MLKNFESIKRQLVELAEVMSKFKSEAVQLRLLELVFADQSSPASGDSSGQNSDKAPVTRKVRRKKPRGTVAPNPTDAKTTDPKRKVISGNGAITTLSKVYAAGFFKQPKTIGDILAHCETNLARKIKANEISGKLARMVRENELRRQKNSENQYQYFNP